MSGPGVIASNFRPIGKGTLVGAVDIRVPAWRITFYGCLWHRRDGKEWIALAGREWLDRNGDKQFAALAKFDRDVHDRFQAAALDAVHALAGEPVA